MLDHRSSLLLNVFPRSVSECLNAERIIKRTSGTSICSGSLFFMLKCYFFNDSRSAYFRASLRALPALKTGALEAGISISSPVDGLWPLRAARTFASKVPKPTRETFSHAFRDSSIVASAAVTAFSASFLDRLLFSATAAIG